MTDILAHIPGVAPALSLTEWGFAMSNLAITVAYFVIATTRIPTFNLQRQRVRNALLVGSAFLFFVLCAWTHADMALHTLAGDAPEWFSEPHMWAQHPFQAVAGLTFWRATKNTRINVFDKEHYDAVIRDVEGR